MMNLDVIFEDNHMLVLNKPSGLMTQPSGTSEENLQDFAKIWLKEKYLKSGNVFLEPIHRLDRAASGLVVFAKTSKALSRLNSEVRGKSVKKIYLALVSTSPPSNSGLLVHYMLHNNFRAAVVAKERADSKEAKLHYKIMNEAPGEILLEVELFTGRYHQIRAQLAEIGSPILGDKKYGSKDHWKFPGIALHHCRLEILHPIAKEVVVFESLPTWITAA